MRMFLKVMILINMLGCIVGGVGILFVLMINGVI